MSPAEEARLEQRIHELELRVVERIAELAGKIDSALQMGKSVDDHESRLRALERTRRPSWRDIGGLITVLIACASMWIATQGPAA